MNNVKGILLLIGLMAAFALEDMFIKYLSVSFSTGQSMIVVGIFCGFIFATIMSVVTRKRIFDSVAGQPLLLVRSVPRL